ncbi:Hypothetical predicted protein [Pelobates cultripes]|uniref:Uncharacterized protein n=1 Tax=Pelobates cultripes TaxID=61616 RepID=A0AAD1WUX8_PELCU|nr:Hypothetical predicted protein [Pelobates cultripes]
MVVQLSKMELDWWFNCKARILTSEQDVTLVHTTTNMEHQSGSTFSQWHKYMVSVHDTAWTLQVPS